MTQTQTTRRESSRGLLQIAGIAKSFGRLEVIRSIDLDVAPGETLGIIGPNGAGKSTLFNLISGVQRPSCGTISFDGHGLEQLDVSQRSRLGIGRTYQVPRPFRGMSVFENLLVAATHSGRMRISDAKDHCADILRATGLLHRQAQLAATLGLLDLKRLELARALSLHPKLLLLDEVAGGLTDGECETLVELIRKINARGVTIIWVEHVLKALRSVATRLAMLSGGTILSNGPCDEVLADPAVRDAYLGNAAT